MTDAGRWEGRKDGESRLAHSLRFKSGESIYRVYIHSIRHRNYRKLLSDDEEEMGV